MCGEVLYSEVGNRREGPPVIKADKCVVERVFAVIECGKVRARLLFTLEKDVLFFSLFDACGCVSVEVSAFLPN